MRRHRNAQRLLQPLKVVNPYAHHLTFLSDKTRTRRDHKKYLTLIRTVALLHQYQRPVKTVTRAGNTVEYIEVTLDDVVYHTRLVARAPCITLPNNRLEPRDGTETGVTRGGR